MTVQEFWNTSHWGDWFGRRRIINGVVSIHSGRDINGHPVHTEVPALNGGTVTAVGERYDIGYYVEIKAAADRYETYAHVLPNVKVGDRVARGYPVAKLAGKGDVHGSLWTGVHLHFMVSPRAGAGYGFRKYCINPDPFITAALTGGGGGGGNNESDDDMLEQRPTFQTDQGDFFHDDDDIFYKLCPLTNGDGSPHPQHKEKDGSLRERCARSDIQYRIGIFGDDEIVPERGWWPAPILVTGDYVVMAEADFNRRQAAKAAFIRAAVQ